MLCYKKVKYHIIFLMDPTPRRVYPTLWGSRRWEAHQGSAAVRAATTQPQPRVLCWALRRAQEGGSRHAAAIDLCIMATKQPLSLLWCALVRELPKGGSMSLCISAFHSSLIFWSLHLGNPELCHHFSLGSAFPRGSGLEFQGRKICLRDITVCFLFLIH